MPLAAAVHRRTVMVLALVAVSTAAILSVGAALLVIGSLVLIFMLRAGRSC